MLCPDSMTGVVPLVPKAAVHHQMTSMVAPHLVLVHVDQVPYAE